MQSEIEIGQGLNQREDLKRIIESSSEYLASRDTDEDSQAHAKWKLYTGPNGEPLIKLDLTDQNYRTTRSFSPRQLEQTESREYRLLSVWGFALVIALFRR